MGQSESGRGRSAHEFDVLRHELSNVMSGLTGMMQWLRDSGLDPRQERWLDAMDDSLRQIVFLLRDSRCRTGTVASTWFDGLSCLEHIVSAHTSAAVARGLRLLLVFDSKLPGQWRSDPGLVRQLLDNLVGNAVKYSESGDVVVSAHRGRNGDLVLAVSDSGRGVSRCDRSRIFGVRERGANCGAESGSGIGLSVCREIAGSLGGEIDCSAGDAGGSVFTVRIRDVPMRNDCPMLSAALINVRCELDVDRLLDRSLQGFLDRLGVGLGAGEAPLEIRIREPGSSLGLPWAGVEIDAKSGEWTGTVRLAPPVLSSGLAEALLGLALAWRWRRLSPDDTRD